MKRGGTDGADGTHGTYEERTVRGKRKIPDKQELLPTGLRLYGFLVKLAPNDAPGAVLAPNLLLAAQSGGIFYAFTEATLEGKLVLAVLFIASIFSWSVMVTKMRIVPLAKKKNERFLQRLRADRQPLRLSDSHGQSHASPLFSLSPPPSPHPPLHPFRAPPL